MMMKRFSFLVALVGLIAVLCIPSSWATIIELEDDNSVAYIEPDDPSSQLGMFSWVVDGVGHLAKQWFWYRVGDTGGESSVDNLTIDAAIASDTNGSGNDDTLFVRYLDPAGAFKIEIRYVLDGGSAGSNVSDIAEQINIENLTDSDLDIHFFQYTDFDLNDTLGDDTVRLINNNTFMQYDESIAFSEVVATPAGDQWAADYFANTLTALNDGSPTDLGTVSGPLTGDVTFSWQWDFNIDGGGTALISKDKNIREREIPEPSTLLLLGSGLFGLSAFARLKRRKREL
jgi:hypothetical protein